MSPPRSVRISEDRGYPLAGIRNALDAGKRWTHTLAIPGIPPASDPPSSEHLARRWFETIDRGDFDRLSDLLHDDIQLVSRVRAGEVVEGRADVIRFIRETVADSLYEANADLYVPLDESRVIVEGRMRWMDEQRVIRDDPVVWGLEFEDELLVRFVPARTVVEAETILNAAR
jgi:hypothetical protein